MLGKPQWFKRRKYAGWGFWPRCWQGWVYLMVIALPLFVIQAVPFRSDEARLIALFVWGMVIFFDSVHIMMKMPKDERERTHEAIAERNALWAIILVLCVGVAYQAAVGLVRGQVTLDPVIFIALFAGILAKAATNIHLDRHD